MFQLPESGALPVITSGITAALLVLACAGAAIAQTPATGPQPRVQIRVQ